MEILTPEAITALLAGSRQRGAHERFLREFADSGNMYAIVNESPQYAGKDIRVVKNTLSQKAKSCNLGNVRLVKNGDNLLIVNTDKLDMGDSEDQ